MIIPYSTKPECPKTIWWGGLAALCNKLAGIKFLADKTLADQSWIPKSADIFSHHKAL